jgi:hypothetical protein
VAILSLASLSLRVLSTAPHGISSACHDTLHIASYCCSAGVIYQLMIGHNDNTCLQVRVDMSIFLGYHLPSRSD